MPDVKSANTGERRPAELDRDSVIAALQAREQFLTSILGSLESFFTVDSPVATSALASSGAIGGSSTGFGAPAPAAGSAGAPSMAIAGFSSRFSLTRFIPSQPHRKNTMPATRTPATPLLISMLSMQRSFLNLWGHRDPGVNGRARTCLPAVARGRAHP